MNLAPRPSSGSRTLLFSLEMQASIRRYQSPGMIYSPLESGRPAGRRLPRMADEVEITISSHPRWLRLVRQVVHEYALETGFDAQDAHAITLAVGEAVGNVIKHSYRGRTDQFFVLRCASLDNALEISLSDHGEPFDPSAQPTLPPDELRPGGRGLYLMRKIMDAVEFGRDNGSNVVRMRKLFPSPALKDS